MSSDEVNEELGEDCARFILSKSCSNLPIKKADIAKYLHGNDGQLTNKKINLTITKAADLLEDIYGFKLQRVASKTTPSYILILEEPLEDQECEHKHEKLLFISLAHIFMSGGTVAEENMWSFLDKAGEITLDDIPKRKILTQTFTRQLYLQYEKVGEAGNTKYVFKWGERASLEMPKMDLLKRISVSLGKEINHWSEQYDEAKKIDETPADLLTQTQS